MLDVKHLRVLVEIVDRGTFSAAAEALSYTQGAVSQQIAALERQVGAPVLIRGTKPLRPTQTGRLLVEHAAGILERFQAAERELRAVGDLRSGRLSVASFPTATIALGSPAVATFRRRHPGVRTRTLDADPAESLSALLGGEVELAIVFDYDNAPMALPDGMRRMDLLEEPMLLALPSEHPLAYTAALRLHDLREDTWIGGRSERCRAALTAACDLAGFTPVIGHETDDYSVVKDLVGARAGVAMVPHLATGRIPSDVVLRTLPEQLPTRRIGVVWLAGHQTTAASAMVDALRRHRRR